jgi:hypothetical protein
MRERNSSATTMKIKMSDVAMLAMIVSGLVPGPVQAATLSNAEATFLDQLVTASVVLEQRCVGYEVDGAGSVQLGARMLGSPDAAYSAAIKARDGDTYDFTKFRPEVSEAASKTFRRVRAELIKDPRRACADYGEAGVGRGLLRRY